MIKITRYFIPSLAICFCVLIASCDSSENTSKTSQDMPKISAPSSTSSTTSTSSSGTSTKIQQLSVEASSCVNLVNSGKYAEAIEPCQRAIQDSSNTEVSQAYEKAKAEIKGAAESAATEAATEAAKDAASDTLRSLGGN